MSNESLLGALLLRATTRRSVFVSYYHDRDQAYYDEFSRVFSDLYGIVKDNSLYRLIDSDDSEYVMRRIREEYITGTSCTIVLCGPDTPWRKYVDWEIKATLDKEHGLIGVNLPHNPQNHLGCYYVPDRLHDNINSGYALWVMWSNLIRGGVATLKSWVELAITREKPLIRNARPMRERNGQPPWQR